MTSFLNKLRTFTVGTSHDLLDKAIDMNSPVMVRQYVRDLEDALGKLNSEAASEDGQIRTATRLKSDLDKKITADKVTISKFIEDSHNTQYTEEERKRKDNLARTKAAGTVQDSKQSLAYEQTIQEQTAALEKLKTTISVLEQKHTLMVNQVRELDRLDHDSKAKEQAARAIGNAASLVNGGADISIDDVAAKINARHDQAEAKFDQALGSMPPPEDSSEDVDALLNSLTPTHQ